jgi:DmsE family decaheme c-type cytochrome
MSGSMVARALALSRRWSILILFAACLVIQPSPAGADAAADADCLLCHDDGFDQPVNSSWHVLHSTRDSGVAAGCTGCHGISDSHLEDPDNNAPDVVYGGDRTSPVETQNASCLACHQGDKQTWWAGSEHDDADLTCSACHTVHVNNNLTADPIAVSGLCYECHAQVRSAARMRSRHPIEEGRTACVDCHNPHGSSTEALLAEPTLNDNCYRCHAEKRGPFLFEHAPVTEDCSHCHQPHGSINDALLTARTPFLCQQCHSAAFHPSLPTTGSGLPGGSANQNLLSKNCLNCHSQVHGSNHPSGGRITR